MGSVFKLSNEELHRIGNQRLWPSPPQNLGDITVVCHTSNQAPLLQGLLNTAKSITNKIIILDDCSKDDTVKIAVDNGCRVYNIPEGWIYTHGFGELLKRQQALCSTEYHLQLDTGEYLYLNPDVEQILTENYYWTLRVHFQASPDHPGFRQPMLNRLFRTNVPLTCPAVIHGSPREPQAIQGKLAHAEMIIFHGQDNMQGSSKYYTQRKHRLYFKLLKKGYETDTLENSYWSNLYKENKEHYDSLIKEYEDAIGVLDTTAEDITLMK
jgi:glycosyltransferase involved in cell wall biosynthesis